MSSFSDYVPVKSHFGKEVPANSADGFLRLENVWLVLVIKILVTIVSC